MRRTISRIYTLLGLLLMLCIQNLSLAETRTSQQTGYFSAGATWVGGVAPVAGDDIIISNGHTVTLDINAQPKNVTIQNGAVLNNGSFDLIIYSATPGGNPTYTNNGMHNGAGNLIAYDGGQTSLSGNGITNCNIVIVSYGLSLLNTCNLIVNGNVQHAVPGNNGMNNKLFIEASQLGSSITINGNLIGNENYTYGIENNGTIVVNGTVYFAGGLQTGGGPAITNFGPGTFVISGNLELGAYSGYCQNFGNMTIGGDLLGAYDTYFIQEANSSVKFGGSVFAFDNGFLFAVESPIYGSSFPNTIEFNGSTAQNIPIPTDMAYSNLTIGNTNSVASIGYEINVIGDLNIKPGSALTVEPSGTISVGGTFTIESDATGTGSFISGSAISGNVERYIAGHDGNNNDGWHLLSSPVAAQAISAFHTAGSGDDFYKWDEPSSTWINRTAEGGGLNGSFETNFSVGKGYLIANVQSASKMFSGLINSSNVNISGLGSDGISPYAGWHLLGNPYSSAIIWNDGNWALNNIDANAQVWNEANASYSVIAATEAIPAMNGFMVHASQNNASLTIPASSRVHNDMAWYKNTLQNDRIILTAIDSEGGTAQPTIIRFNDNATANYDSQYDCLFLPGFAPIFYSGTQNEKFALNTLPELSGGLTIPMGFQKNGSNRFSIELTENIPGQAVYLTDITNGVTINLAENSYFFEAGEGENADRFLLHFNTLGIDKPLVNQKLSAWVYSKVLYLQSNEPGNLFIYDIQGRMLVNYTVDSDGFKTLPINLPSGIYLVSLEGKSTVKSVKVIVQ